GFPICTKAGVSPWHRSERRHLARCPPAHVSRSEAATPHEKPLDWWAGVGAAWGLGERVPGRFSDKDGQNATHPLGDDRDGSVTTAPCFRGAGRAILDGRRHQNYPV